MWLAAIALALVSSMIGGVLWVQLSGAVPPGLRVLGQPVPNTSQLDLHLSQLRDAWANQQVALLVDDRGFGTTREQLGADLDVHQMSRRVRSFGRGDNALANGWLTLTCLLRGAELPWPVRIDASKLQRALAAVRRQVEVPPMVGTRDADGQVISGRDGATINPMLESDRLVRGLRDGATEFRLQLRRVPAPEPLAIGAADGAVYTDDLPPPDSGERPELPAELLEAQEAAKPDAWLPDQGPECITEGAYRGFCEGPRRVPEPHGTAADRAESLELGGPRSVAMVLSGRVPASWRAISPLETLELLRPVPGGRLWRRFGMVTHTDGRRRLHKGLDIGAPEGTPIRAVQAGLVVYSDNAVRGYGNLLVVVHGDGSAAFYAHCHAIYVFPGQRVARGSIVGEVGDTGFARGKHLHFELHEAGAPVDPIPRFAQIADF